MSQNQKLFMFRCFVQVAAPVVCQTTLFDGVRQVAAPGEKSAISDCILLGF